ncbi:MAG: GGDEF domain-containing protein, partial [Actinomycetes bacterium]
MGIALDVLIMAAGLSLATPCVVAWIASGGSLDVVAVAAIALVVVMSRFSLVLTHRSGDIMIGFEPCVLVYLLLTGSGLEAFAIWSIAATVAMLVDRETWRARIFNVGDVILGGALFTIAFAAVGPSPGQKALELGAVLVGSTLYFAFDLLLTAGSIAIEDGRRVGTVVAWRSVPLGLACFVSVGTLGYLAALLHEDQPVWTLLLLLVPVGTILVAVRTVSDNRLAQRRLVGLLEAATHAPEWADDEQIERSLLAQTERTLWQTTASLRDHPPEGKELGAPLHVDGRSTRYLVVRPEPSAHPFTSQDVAALEALTAVGASAFHRRRLTDEMTYLARHDALTGLHNRNVFTER